MSDFRNKLIKICKEENGKTDDELIKSMMRFYMIQLILCIRRYRIEVPDDSICDLYEMAANLTMKDHQLEYSWDFYCTALIGYMNRTGTSVQDLKEMGAEELYRKVLKK